MEHKSLPNYNATTLFPAIISLNSIDLFRPCSTNNFLRFGNLWTRKTCTLRSTWTKVMLNECIYTRTVRRVCECEQYSSECTDICYENGELERYDGKKISLAFPIYESQLAALETSTARTAHTVIVCRLFSSLSLHCSWGVCMGERKHNTSTQSCCDGANCDGRDRDTRRVAAIEHSRGAHTSNSPHFIHHTHTHIYIQLAR